MKNGYVVNFREVMITIILAVLCGFVYLGWGPLYSLLDGVLPGAGEVVYGTWFLAGPLAAFIVRKPGVAIIAEMAAASGELLMGGQYGLSTLLYGLAQGVASEAVFALFRYRTFNVGTVLLAGAAAALASLAYDALTGSLAEFTNGVLVTKIVLRTVSGAIFGGLLAKIIVDLLAKTGVLNSYAVVRNKLQNPLA